MQQSVKDCDLDDGPQAIPVVDHGPQLRMSIEQRLETVAERHDAVASYFLVGLLVPNAADVDACLRVCRSRALTRPFWQMFDVGVTTP